MNADQILARYPKLRQPLPPEYQAVYNSHYLKNREGKTSVTRLSKRLESWMHKQVARDIRKSGLNLKTLEIGAGTLNQLAYEPSVQDYDVVEPFVELFENSPRLDRVRRVVSDIHELNSTEKYSRITSIATFEHIVDLPSVVAKAATLLESDGCLRVAIPNEGTVLWKLGTKVTGREYRRLYGLDYQVLMKFEHVNTADEIEAVLQHFFETTRTSVCGIHRKLAFYRFIECQAPKLNIVANYLADRNGPNDPTPPLPSQNGC